MDPEDPIYFPPRTITALSQVPEQWREWYSRTGNSGPWNIDERMWTEVVEPSRVEYDALVAQKEKIAADQRQLEIERVDAKRERVERALSTALVAAGAKKGLAAGAVAILMEQHRFEVEPPYEGTGYVVMADIAGSLASVEHVAREFLDGDEGEPFRGTPRELQSDGRFTSIIEDLKRRR